MLVVLNFLALMLLLTGDKHGDLDGTRDVFMVEPVAYELDIAEVALHIVDFSTRLHELRVIRHAFHCNILPDQRDPVELGYWQHLFDLVRKMELDSRSQSV